MTPPAPSLPGAEHHFVDVDGLRMHVAQAGAGEPLVMLHGWPQHWYEFRHLIPALSADYRVICPDLRGFGRSQAPPSGYEKAQLVRDVLGLLDALDVGRFRLVGHDWGTILGFMLCLEAPDRVRAFLALGGAHLWPALDLRATWAFRRFWYQLAIATPGLGPRLVSDPRFVRLLYRVWAARHDAWTDADLEALTAQFADPARARASSLLYRIWLMRELGPMIAGRYRRERLVTPTLFLHGAEDGCIDPVFARPARRNAPGMTVELLPGIGHFVPEEAPGR